MPPGETQAPAWPSPRAYRRGVRRALAGLGLVLAFAWLTEPSPLIAGLGSGIGLWVGALVGGYLANAPASERRARVGEVVRGALVLALALASVGAAGFGAYVLAKSAGEAACVEAMSGPSAAGRRAEGAAIRGRWGWVEALLHKRVTIGCETLERELDVLASDGLCPRFPLPSVACRCGQARFDGASSACPGSREICDQGPGGAAERLRCVDEAEIASWTEPRL